MDSGVKGVDEGRHHKQFKRLRSQIENNGSIKKKLFLHFGGFSLKAHSKSTSD